MRAAIVLTTVCVTGLFVGSGVAWLLAPMPGRTRPPPLPRLEVPETMIAEALTGGLFAPADEPPGPGPDLPPDGDRACEVPWRLVGTMLDRRRPNRSFAAIHTPSGAQLLAVSMTHEELTLVELDAEAATLERGDGRRCTIRMFTTETTTTEIVTALAEPTAPPEHPWIRHLSSSHVELDPTALGQIGALNVQAIPQMENGQVAGVRLFGIRRTSPLAAAGIANGDVVRAIDGIAIRGPDVALEALGRLRSGAPVRVTIATGATSREVTVSLGTPPR